MSFYFVSLGTRQAYVTGLVGGPILAQRFLCVGEEKIIKAGDRILALVAVITLLCKRRIRYSFENEQAEQWQWQEL